MRNGSDWYLYLCLFVMGLNMFLFHREMVERTEVLRYNIKSLQNQIDRMEDKKEKS